MLKDHVRIADKPSQLRPTPEQLKAAVRKTLPFIKERALSAERNRRVPEENISALREAGLFKVVQPREFGGYEYDYPVLVDLVIEVGTACASTAWIAGLFAAHQWLLANMGIDVQHDVWDENPDAVMCGSYAPTGTAIAVDGGYRLSGRWEFASGCDNAHWSFCAAIVPADGNGTPPGPAFFLVPARDYLIEDTWDVVGLAGTGSKTLVLDQAFVPGHRRGHFGPLVAGNAPGAVTYPRRGFDVPMLCVIPSCLASVAVGTAKGALDDYIAATSKRITRGAVAGSNNRMAEFATVQLRVAEAAASVDAARMKRHQESPGDRWCRYGRPDHQPAGAGFCGVSCHSCGGGSECVDRRLRAGYNQFGATRLARRQCGRTSYQPELGCGRHDVRSNGPRARPSRPVLNERRLRDARQDRT